MPIIPGMGALPVIGGAAESAGISAGVGSIIGSGISGAISFLGGDRANDRNQEIAREQMSFQERMSSTAYQRAMQDMRKAGLNPMLAYKMGGASTPGGAGAHMENVAGGAVNSALAYRDTAIKGQQADTQTMAAQSQVSLNDAIKATQYTQALANTASAKQMTINTALAEAALPSAVKHGVYDSQLAPLDAIMRRVGEATGALNPIRLNTGKTPDKVLTPIGRGPAAKKGG